MAQYGDPEGTFSSIKTVAEPGDIAGYRTTPQFAVSVGKFAVMSLCTFGFYELYWAYKHWDAVRRREQESLSPFWRAFFAPLWGFSLLPRLQQLTAVYGVPATWSGSGLALAYFLLHIAYRLPGALWLVSLLSFLPLLVVQRSVNELNRAVAPEAPRNDSYSGLNVVGIVLGGTIILLAIVGTLVPLPEAQGPVQVST